MKSDYLRSGDLSPEFKLLLWSLRPGENPGVHHEAQALIESNSINWEQLCSRARIHCIRPQLAQLAGRIPLKLIPSVIKEELNDAYGQNLVTQIRFTDEFFRIRDMLLEAGVQIIPFKGFWLAWEAYGNLADRESLDVDVFADEAQLEKIRTLMTSAGYSEEGTFRKLTIDEIKAGYQEYNFNRVEENTNTFHIEFHWGICPPEYNMGIGLEDLSNQITTGSFQGRELAVFTPSAQLLLSVFHHGGKDRFTLLKQVDDFARIIRSCGNIDWDWVLCQARRYRAESLVYTAVNLASALAGVTVPAEIRSRVESGKVRRLADDRIRLMSREPRYYFSFLFNLDNWLFRIRSRTGIFTKIRLTAASFMAVRSRHKISQN
jgi:hypothetical protein